MKRYKDIPYDVDIVIVDVAWRIIPIKTGAHLEHINLDLVTERETWYFSVLDENGDVSLI